MRKILLYIFLFSFCNPKTEGSFKKEIMCYKINKSNNCFCCNLATDGFCAISTNYTSLFLMECKNAINFGFEVK